MPGEKGCEESRKIKLILPVVKLTEGLVQQYRESWMLYKNDPVRLAFQLVTLVTCGDGLQVMFGWYHHDIELGNAGGRAGPGGE